MDNEKTKCSVSLTVRILQIKTTRYYNQREKVKKIENTSFFF